MICSPTNAYPNGTSINGDNLPEFKLTFYGDYTIGADFKIYDYLTNIEVTPFHYDRHDNLGFYNGEELGIQKWGSYTLPQKKRYVWQATFYENVDFDNGYYPTNIKLNGTSAKRPFIDVTVQIFPTIVAENFIPIGTGLDIKLPCYIHHSEYGFKSVVSYDTYSGLVKINSKYPVYPEVGEELLVCKYKSTSGSGVENAIFVEPNLVIDDDSHKGFSSTDIPNSYVYVNDTYYPIPKYGYKSKTGVLSLDGLSTSIPSGTKFQIYTCAVKTPFYYFTTKAIPTVSANMELVQTLIKCTATIPNAGDYPVKYYQWQIYKDGVLVETSERIYGGMLTYLVRGVEDNAIYTAKIKVVTQDNVEIESDLASLTIPQLVASITNLKAVIDNTKNAVKLTWTNTGGGTQYNIIRKSATEYKLLETVVGVISTYYDYSCADLTSYEYIVVPKDGTNILNKASVVITTKFNNWSVYFLNEIPYVRPVDTIIDIRIFYDYMNGERQFEVNSVWNIEFEPRLEEITHNIKRNSENTYNGKPVITMGNRNYDSFNLSFMLGNLSCPTYDLTGYNQQTFNLWKEQINSQKPVLIKDSKGNVWFGAIMSHSFNISYDLPTYQPYNVSVEFSQLRDMAKVKVLTD